MKLTFLTVFTALFFLAFPETVYPCGKERWLIKVAQDEHINYFFEGHKITSKKLKRAEITTIAQLHGQAWPFGKAIKPPNDARTSLSTVEYRIWTVTAFLIAKSDQRDKDYHLVLKDDQRTLIAEIPHPDCIRQTPEPIKGLIKKARKDFDELVRRKRALNQKVRVTGLGFFDTRCNDAGQCHGTGSSPNGIELHPVICIEPAEQKPRCPVQKR